MRLKRIIYISLSSAMLLLTAAQADDVTIGDISARVDDLEKCIRGENPAGDELATKDDVEILAGLVKSLTGRVEVLEHRLDNTLQSKQSIPADTDTAMDADLPAAPAADLSDAEQEGAVIADETDETEVNAVLESLGSRTKEEHADTKKSAREKVVGKRQKATENAEKSPTPTFDTDSAAAQFNQAKGLLSKGQYVEAETAFEYYLTEHGSRKEANAALVHLGEAQLKQGKYTQAKANFAKAYKANSKGTQGAKALLGLGEALGVKDKKSACTVLRKLKEDFPSHKGTIGKANALMKKYKCS